jgi:hypothetical protein
MYFQELDAAKIAGALAPAFTAGFAVQQTIELVDTLLSFNSEKWAGLVGNPAKKKLITSVIGLLLAIFLVIAGKFNVISPLLPADVHLPTFLPGLITVIFISGGTEGFNSLLKFISWKKEEAKAKAADKPSKAASAAVGS